jgi:dipeptidyl aminopeptidase/acylaminoacyl peptidase
MPNAQRAISRIALTFAIAIIALPAAVVSQSATTGRALAIEDYYRVKTIGGPVMSPDGKSVAFTVSTRVEATNGTTSEVWVVPSDGSTPANRVSPEGANASGPSWTTDNQLRFSVAGETVTPAGGRGGGRGGRGSRLASPDGKLVASVRDVPPPRR